MSVRLKLSWTSSCGQSRLQPSPPPVFPQCWRFLLKVSVKKLKIPSNDYSKNKLNQELIWIAVLLNRLLGLVNTTCKPTIPVRCWKFHADKFSTRISPEIPSGFLSGTSFSQDFFRNFHGSFLGIPLNSSRHFSNFWPTSPEVFHCFSRYCSQSPSGNFTRISYYVLSRKNFLKFLSEFIQGPLRDSP